MVLVASTAFASPSPYGSGWSAKVDPRVLQGVEHRGSVGFWILFRASADLSAAPSIAGWETRGAFVVERLVAVATGAQRETRALLDRQHVQYRSFWIVNGIRVSGASLATIRSVSARPEVRSRRPALERPRDAAALGRAGDLPSTSDCAAGVEWNVADIRANKVWKRFDDRGEGSVVGSIDTGAQFDHPALVKSYRGNEGDGVFDHDYDWWDPAHVCPGGVPCDNVAHGTHTMGTIVGKAPMAGIGVAPGAEWIEAKGCEDVSCSDTSLLSSGQFMLAPTDRKGKHPRPALRPDVVSNSWGGAGSDTFYQAMVTAWTASGIVPVFSGGGSGPSCGTIGAPASYVGQRTASARTTPVTRSRRSPAEGRRPSVARSSRTSPPRG